MNQGRIEDASSDKYLPKDLVARIEKQRVELLLPDVPQARSHSSKNVRRPTDQLIGRTRVTSRGPPQLQRRLNQGRV
jgi:hypothetical protein